MNLDRHLARLLAAVIVMIAATFGVSTVQAHEGHAHHRAPAATPSAPATVSSPETRLTSPAPTVAKAAPALVGRSLLASAAQILSRADQVTADDRNDCDGQCCSMGMTCCHSALTPATLATVPKQVLSGLVLAAPQTVPASLAPEALPKPPPSFRRVTASQHRGGADLRRCVCVDAKPSIGESS